MWKAVGTLFGGVGLTLASTFASAMGLSHRAQVAGFVTGVVLLVASAAFLLVDLVRRWRAGPRLMRHMQGASGPVSGRAVEHAESHLARLGIDVSAAIGHGNQLRGMIERERLQANLPMSTAAASRVRLSNATVAVEGWKASYGLTGDVPSTTSATVGDQDFARLWGYVDRQLALLHGPASTDGGGVGA